jgi:hypothetical protein
MSSYKVIQDIEAEDKLVGPLTLRQFIYAGIAAVCLYLCFVAYTKHALFLIGIFLPIAAITTFFAFPWKGEQPTEIWALARLRFMLKPRVRVWDQSNVKDLVTVLAPRRLENHHPRSANLSENEVRSRLKALADTIDSRGWATRNASFGFQMLPQNQVLAPGQAVLNNLNSDNDIFDERGSVAQNFDAMLARSTQNHRERVIQQLEQAQQPQPSMPSATTMPAMTMPPMPTPGAMYGPAQAPAVAAPPATYMPPSMPSLPAPVMPSQDTQPLPPYTPPPLPPVAAASAAPASDYWFANGPTYPGNTDANGKNAPLIAPPLIPESYTAAVASGKIMTDVPIADAAKPTADEDAFGQIVKEQVHAAQQINYGHLKVLQPLPSQTGPDGQKLAPSIPGMIDYGRPQPMDDQMQYDTSLPQSQSQAAGIQPAANAVTGKPDPAIIDTVSRFATNDDLDIATIARQVKKEAKQSPDEVEIRLH